MSQPPAYNREADFTKNHGSVQNDSLLNSELDDVSQSINALRERQALLLKDDDTLVNNIVTEDSLTASLQDSFNQIAVAVSTADEAKTIASEANATADEAKTIASEANATADEAKTIASEANATADEAKTIAQNTETHALTASRAAEAAETAANNAAESASDAKTEASAASTTASTALENANTALSKGLEAVSTADEAKTTADEAKTIASEANATADEAKTIASEANATADEALENANTALSKGLEAVTKAQTAVDTVEELQTNLPSQVETEVAKQVIAKQDITAEKIALALGYSPADGDDLIALQSDLNEEAKIRLSADSALQDNIDAVLPPQTGNANKFLTTDGTSASWASVPSVGGDTAEAVAEYGTDYIRYSSGVQVCWAVLSQNNWSYPKPFLYVPAVVATCHSVYSDSYYAGISSSGTSSVELSVSNAEGSYADGITISLIACGIWKE